MGKKDVVGCDGTVTNKGWKNGVINQIENHVGRPLKWNICLLHFNELPFRHIFQHIDCQTAGPNSFSGLIGQQLTCYEKLPVVDYEPIDWSIPDIERNLLSRDQQYLLDISNAITLGRCPEDLANLDPGPLSLRLHTSSSDPSGNLKEIVGFILKSYMSVWFAIKKSKYFTDGQNMSFKHSKHHGIYPTNYFKLSNMLCLISPKNQTLNV
ncbi:hypothetical protein AVEN_71696-1 [Araneus ventricosus]|uniref:Uncharacterized protein n=1 Tax=Araneus ventricosus TaxID=182803 RepID=A0A4Y2V2V2_ARAVE|nr:hypothetical protein AVEN_71696-1 [Araneus ventricosus]